MNESVIKPASRKVWWMLLFVLASAYYMQMRMVRGEGRVPFTHVIVALSVRVCGWLFIALGPSEMSRAVIWFAIFSCSLLPSI